MEIADLLLKFDEKLDKVKEDILSGVDTSINGHYLKCMNARLEAEKKNDEKDNKNLESAKPSWYNLINGMNLYSWVKVVGAVLLVWAFFHTDKLTPQQKQVLDNLTQVTKVQSDTGNDYR